MAGFSFPVEGGVWSFPCETPAVPESVAVGVGLSGVSLTVGDGDCDGLDDWTGDVEALGDDDREDDVVGDGDCEGDCVGVAVGVADLVGHAVGEAVAYGTIEVGIVGVARSPGPGAAVEAAFELEPPPVDTYCVDAGLGDAVG